MTARKLDKSIVYLSLPHNRSPWNLQFVYFMLDNLIFSLN